MSIMRLGFLDELERLFLKMRDLRIYHDGVDCTYSDHLCDDCLVLSHWSLVELGAAPPSREYLQCQQSLQQMAESMELMNDSENGCSAT